eukprot:symbB.v1.2.021969.t3/scaffold1899.1/size238565/5
MMRWMLRMRLEADTISYNALLSGLATSDHWKKALQVAEGMKQKSVAPSSITTNSLIDACRTTEEPLWHMAVQLLMALPQSSRTLVSCFGPKTLMVLDTSGSWDFCEPRNYLDITLKLEFIKQLCNKKGRKSENSHTDGQQPLAVGLVKNDFP